MDLERIFSQDPRFECRAGGEKEGGWVGGGGMRLLWLHANSPNERTVVSLVERKKAGGE